MEVLLLIEHFTCSDLSTIPWSEMNCIPMLIHYQGHVTMVEESQKKKKQSEANLYIVPFCRYNLNESMPMSMLKHMEDDVPPVSTATTGFSRCGTR